MVFRMSPMYLCRIKQGISQVYVDGKRGIANEDHCPTFLLITRAFICKHM